MEKAQSIEIIAESLEEARTQVKTKIPVGMGILSEVIVSNGKPKTAYAFAETSEAAFNKAETEIPAGANIMKRGVKNEPSRRTLKLLAYDESSVKAETNSKCSSIEKIEQLTLAVHGSKGLFGIGKKPNQYEVRIFHPAEVEIVYKKKAQVKFKIGYANRGMRQDTMGQATAYWMARIQKIEKDPFVMYTFSNCADARAALLELPCIHEDENGALVCSEVLIYGYYLRQDGIYEAIVCGADLTHELWEQAKASFEKHGGSRKNDLEPTKYAADMVKESAGDPAKVVFIREDRNPSPLGTGTTIYRVHKGPDAASAKAFLEAHPVTKPLFYIIVETPEGNYGRDIEGMYKE
jgi:hypothetical protein